MKLEDLNGAKVVENTYGKFLLVKRDFTESQLGAMGEHISRYRDLLDHSKRRSLEFARFNHREKIFYDIESLGLGNDPIFMIAYAHLNNGVSTRVAFARDLFEETAVLKDFIETIEGYRELGELGLFTYNGKAFDLPRLSDRIRSHRLMQNGTNGLLKYLEENHCDLYPRVRERKGELGLVNCRLTTVEKQLFDFKRTGDVSGKKLPLVYMEWLYGKDADGEEVDEERVVRDIVGGINHNDQDVITMIPLLGRLISDSYKSAKN